MFITFNFKCTNESCRKFNEIEERMVERAKVAEQPCTECGEYMEKTFSPTKFSPHVSWSTWRV